MILGRSKANSIGEADILEERGASDDKRKEKSRSLRKTLGSRPRLPVFITYFFDGWSGLLVQSPFEADQFEV